MRMLPSRIRLLTHNPPIAGANMILDQCTECIIGVDVADPVFLVEIIDGIRPSEIEGNPHTNYVNIPSERYTRLAMAHVSRRCPDSDDGKSRAACDQLQAHPVGMG